MRYGPQRRVECLGVIGDFDYAGKRIVALHGDDRKNHPPLLDEQQHDFLSADMS
jgi:hypothetical protein